MAKKGKKAAVRQAAGPRQRKASRWQRRKYDKKTAKDFAPIPSSFNVTREVIKLFRQHWRLLAGIVFVYLILNIILAGALSNVGAVFDNIRANLQASGGRHIADAIGGFGSLLASAGTGSSSSGSVLQAVLFVLESLVIIWSIRHILAGTTFKVKEAYYHSTSQLIPFLLVAVVMILQLLPVTLGSVIVTTVFSSLFPSGGGPVFFMATIIFLLTIWSLYMLSGSVFALYIVTLPDMLPRDALRSAKNLVSFRRWKIMRRILFMPVLIVLVMAVLVVPLILWADFLVAPVFFVLSMLAILFGHTYLYSLYRSLLE